MSTRREMPVVLWVSKHEILPAESEELHRIFKNFIFLEYRKPIEAREELLSLIRELTFSTAKAGRFPVCRP